MSSQLAVGRKANLATIRGDWLKLNNDRGYQVQVSQNTATPKARYFSVCFRAPKTDWKSAVEDGCCPAHVKAIGPNRDEMTIKSFNLNHTCIQIDNENSVPAEVKERKRNYNTKDITDVSDVLDACEPTKKKEGNTKQFVSMTKSSTGFTLKSGQASMAIRSKSHDTLEAQIGQFFMLPSLFDACGEIDPDGSYYLESTSCGWDRTKRQFRRCYVCLSTAKHFWSKAGIELKVCDATFTKLRAFKLTILLAVTFDGNNQVIILAFAIVSDGENANNWVWFKECLDDDFPGKQVWMSDGDKGIESNDFVLSMSQSSLNGDTMVKSRCARHLSENCKENNTGRMNEDQKNMIIDLAKSRTEDVYNLRLQAIRNDNDGWATWLDRRKNEFVSCTFLDGGWSRHGKVTSNAVENTNNALMSQRHLPIMHMIEEIVHCQREKHAERQKQAAEWKEQGMVLTLFATNEDKDIGDKASKRQVQTIQNLHPVYKANVSVGANSAWNTAFLPVEVNVEDQTGTCPCRNYPEAGAHCYHVKALLLQLGSLGVGEGWCHKRHHLTTYSESYDASIPSMAVAGKLEHDDTFLPPEFKQTAGRPKRKRKSREYMRKTDAKRLCKGCGKSGHFDSTCNKPSTKYRVQTNMKKSIEYCKRIEAASCIEAED